MHISKSEVFQMAGSSVSNARIFGCVFARLDILLS
jgi:hypothetical protein